MTAAWMRETTASPGGAGVLSCRGAPGRAPVDKAPTDMDRKASRSWPIVGSPRELRYPAGSPAECERIAYWVMPHVDNRQRSLGLISHSDVARHLRAFAMALLANRQADREESTLAAEVERIAKVKRTAVMLQRLLKADDGAHGLVRRAALATATFKQMPDGNYDFVGGPEAITKPLQALADAADEASNYVNTRAKSGGGCSNLHRRLHGDPRVYLCSQCAWLLRECRGEDEAPIRVEGEGVVAELARMVWRYATGEDPNEDQFTHAATAGAKSARVGSWQQKGSALLHWSITQKKSD